MTRDTEVGGPTAAVGCSDRLAAEERRGSRILRSPILGLLLLVFIAEFFLFDHFGSHRFTAIYPRWNDQIQYLSEAYYGYHYGRTHGLLAGLWQTLINPAMQGTLHDFAGTLVFAIAGPSRSAALALNLGALLVWQLALFLGCVRVSGSRVFAFAAALLPLALVGPWQDIPGSAYDFRLDHLAMCAMGATSALALLTDGFRRRRASLVFGAAVGVTLLTRFLTGTYFVVLFFVFLAATLRSSERAPRTRNLVSAGAVAFVIAAPFFWLNREWVWNYYYIGHYVGPESAIRNQHFGLVRSLSFLGRELAGRHLGTFFFVLAAASTALLVFVRERTRERRARPAWFFGAAFLLVPALILTLHQQKSEVVVSALVPGVLLLVIALWQTVAGKVRPDSRRLTFFATAVGIAAFASFARLQFTPGPSASLVAENRKVAALADYVFDRVSAAKLDRPAVSIDYITDCLDAQVMRVITFERKKQWIDFEMPLPTGIAAPEAADVFARLERSHFVFLTEAGSGGFPYDRTLEALRPRLRAWCEEHLQLAERFELFGRRMALYQHREIPLAPARP